MAEVTNAGAKTAVRVGVVSSAALLQIAIQFLFQSVIAARFGVGLAVDAYAAALSIPSVLAAILTGSLGYVLIPELVSKFSNRDQERDAWSLATFVLLFVVLIGVAFVAIIYVCANSLCQLLFTDMERSQLRFTAYLLRILSCQTLFLGVISCLQSIHHSRNSFFFPAIGGVFGTGTTLVYAFLIGTKSIDAIAWAINIGSVVGIVIHLAPLLNKLRWPVIPASQLTRLVIALWPLLLGAAFLRLDPLVDRVLASKLADEGSIAGINYTQRIMTALLALGASSLSIVAFPQLAERFKSEGHTGFGDQFSIAFRRLVLIVVPVAAGVSVFGTWIISDLLERGEFTSDDSKLVGGLIAASMGMFIGASTGELLARGFYVLGDTKTPTFTGVFSLSIGLLIKVWLFSRYGIYGIAWGISIYYILSASIMAFFLKHKAKAAVFRGNGLFLIDAFAATLLACGVCQLTYTNLLTEEFVTGRTWIAAPLGALVYAIALLLMNNRDAVLLKDIVLERYLFRSN